MDTPLTAAQLIHRRRTELGISQDEAAKRAGIARRTFQEVESGQRRPMVRTLFKLDTALGLEPGDLAALDTEPDDPALAPIVNELVGMIRSFTGRTTLETARIQLMRLRLAELEGEPDDGSRPATAGDPAETSGPPAR